jgi:hypothetical protein
MFFSILKWIVISLTLIFLIHHLYMFLMNTLTVPKIRDLVNKPNQQYQDIYSTMGGSGAGPSPPIMGKGPSIAGPSIAGAGPSAAGPSASAAGPSASAAANNGIADELSSFLNDLKKTAPEKKNNDFETLANSNDIGYSLY